MPVVILGQLEIRAATVGCALTEAGEPVVVAIDSETQTAVSIVFSPDAWKAFLLNAPRLKGVGIHLPNRAQVAAIRNGGEQSEGR